jgi:hypothetical protein
MGGGDAAKAISGIQDMIAKQEQANAAPELPPMQVAQPQMMMTPAMIRARMLAQAMLNRDMGISNEATA